MSTTDAEPPSTDSLPQTPTLNAPACSGPILENGSPDRHPHKVPNGNAVGSNSLTPIQTDGLPTPPDSGPDFSQTAKTPRKSSISFAPLPQAQRQRRNSITLGVAARSQILRSQGAGRSSSGGAPRPRGPKQVHIYEGGQDWSQARRDQVVDLGELGKKLWKKWREGKRSGGKSMTTEEAAAKEKAEAEGLSEVVEEVRSASPTAVPHPTPGSPPPELEKGSEPERRTLPRRRSHSPVPPSYTAARDVLGFDYADVELELDERDEDEAEDAVAEEEDDQEDVDTAEDKASIPSFSSEG